MKSKTALFDFNKVIAIINPSISANYIGSGFKKYNIKTVAVYTTTYMEHVKPRKGLFNKYFDITLYAGSNEDSIKKLADKLIDMQVDLVLYGHEVDLEIADKLAELVCPEFANSHLTSQYRENKYDTNRILQKHNLPVPKECLIDLSNIDTLNQLDHLEPPLILKPTYITGGLHKVQYFYQRDAIRSYITALLQEHPQETEEAFVAAEIVKPLETKDNIEVSYSIDSISLAGKHHIFSIQKWYKIKEQDKPRYYFAEQLSLTSEHFKLLQDHAEKVLDIVGLRTGFAHPEFFLTKDGPVLIDLNPRWAGAEGIVYKMIEASLGIDPIKLLIDALNGKDLPDKPQALEKHAFLAFVRTQDLLPIETFKGYSSYVCHQFRASFSSNLVLLAHKDKKTCQNELDKLLRMSK